MNLTNQNPPKRPNAWRYTSIAELYGLYENLFLGTGGKLDSACGHSVSVFDHHFFHMAGITVANAGRLFMPDEKDEIRATTTGFGKYSLAHSGSRARDLPSAYATLVSPDEVWMDNPLTEIAKWVYVKEFDSKPYSFTMALLTPRPDENGIIVPVSSFCCRKNRIKVWRQSTRIYP
jgi:hypothetical protein